MLNRLLKALPKGFTRDSVTGVFLSGFDEHRKLLNSQGVVQTDQTLENTMNSLWNESFIPLENTLRAVAIDVVTDTVTITDLSTLEKYSPTEFGFVMVDTEDDRSGVILPNTEGIADAKTALRAMKKKYALHGKVEVVAFRTQRSIVSK